MIEVPKLSYFSPDHYINPFTGKDYEESIQKAKEWALSNGVKLVAYYKQKTFGRSILVSYEEKNKDAN
jgi:hypothetical protein